MGTPTRAEAPAWARRAPRWLAALTATHNLSGEIYGTLVAAAVLATESGTRDGAGKIALVTLATLVVYWFAHGYADMLPARAAGGKAHALADLGRSLRHDLPIVSGSVSLLAVLLLSSWAGADTDLAVDLAIGFAVLELLLWGTLAGRRAELRGRALLAYGLGSAGLGLVIGLLKVRLH